MAIIFCSYDILFSKRKAIENCLLMQTQIREEGIPKRRNSFIEKPIRKRYLNDDKKSQIGLR